MSQRSKNVLLRIADPAFLVSAVATVCFYALMFQPAMHESLLHRYTTEHPAEYVIVALMFWGIVDILFHLAGFPRDLLALRETWLPPWQGREPVEHARGLLAAVLAKPARLRESRIGRRLSEALSYVVEKGAADEFREHLQYLADQDDEHTHASYTLTRFIIGVTPVLGFLGTVVHFGTALSGISYDEMADKLPVVVGEMGQAFNTTTSALAAAMSMMFSLFVCERIERSIVRSVDRYVDRELMNRFENKNADLVPFLQVIKTANDDALKVIAETIDWQTDVWTQAFEAILQSFDERQRAEAKGWTQALSDLTIRHEQFDAAREQRLKEMVTVLDARQEKFLGHIQSTLEKALLLRDDFGDLLTALQTVAKGEGKLAELQAGLTKNLRLIHETQKIDEALHGLTAAIHLLTARNSSSSHNAAA